MRVGINFGPFWVSTNVNLKGEDKFESGKVGKFLVKFVLVVALLITVVLVGSQLFAWAVLIGVASVWGAWKMFASSNQKLKTVQYAGMTKEEFELAVDKKLAEHKKFETFDIR